MSEKTETSRWNTPEVKEKEIKIEIDKTKHRITLLKEWKIKELNEELRLEKVKYTKEALQDIEKIKKILHSPYFQIFLNLDLSRRNNLDIMQKLSQYSAVKIFSLWEIIKLNWDLLKDNYAFVKEMLNWDDINKYELGVDYYSLVPINRILISLDSLKYPIFQVLCNKKEWLKKYYDKQEDTWNMYDITKKYFKEKNLK